GVPLEPRGGLHQVGPSRLRLQDAGPLRDGDPEGRAALRPLRRSGGVITFVEEPDGPLRVWQEPEPGRLYVVGADVAEGLEHGDYSCAQVLDVASGAQVAMWHGHVQADLFGDVLYDLG